RPQSPADLHHSLVAQADLDGTEAGDAVIHDEDDRGVLDLRSAIPLAGGRRLPIDPGADGVAVGEILDAAVDDRLHGDSERIRGTADLDLDGGGHAGTQRGVDAVVEPDERLEGDDLVDQFAHRGHA